MKINDPLKQYLISNFEKKYQNKSLNISNFQNFIQEGEELERKFNIEIEFRTQKMDNGDILTILQIN